MITRPSTLVPHLCNKIPVFVGCGFAAKYPEGGGNFSVPLQYMTGLKRMKGYRGIWLEVLQSSGDPSKDAHCILTFQRRMRAYGLEYCLLLRPAQTDKGLEEHHLDQMQVYGVSAAELRELPQHGVLLNLSYSIKPPLTNLFGRRLLCSLDPTEVLFWMDQMEMGQSSHDEFWSIGLCMDQIDPRLPKPIVPWKSYFPLVDTELLKPQPHPAIPHKPKFTTIGQWYWDGSITIGGEWRDYSKQAAFAPYLDLPKRVKAVTFELAMNLNPGDPERERLRSLGWKVVTPHRLTRTPAAYYRYLAGATAEFTAVKLEAIMGSGWLSDRAAAFLALGRPVVTEPTGAEQFLPAESGMLFVRNLEEAVEASVRVVKEWPLLAKCARSTALEYFDSVKNLKLLLGIK